MPVAAEWGGGFTAAETDGDEGLNGAFALVFPEKFSQASAQGKGSQ